MKMHGQRSRAPGGTSILWRFSARRSCPQARFRSHVPLTVSSHSRTCRIACRPTALQPFDEGRNPRQRGFMVTKNPLAIQVPEPRNPPRDILSAGHGSTGTVAFSLPRTNLRSPSTSPPSDSKWASVPQLHSQRREAFSSVSPKVNLQLGCWFRSVMPFPFPRIYEFS